MMSSDSLSGSVFAIEVDRRPVVVFSTKLYSHAEEICADPRIRAKLKAVLSGGQSLCDDTAKLRVRLARAEEKEKYHDEAAKRSGEQSLMIVYLVPLDDASAADIEAAKLD
jgi:hypothetical protein